MASKRKGRIRQTLSKWQEFVEANPGRVESISWHDRLPELLHISINLAENDFSVVKNDFNTIADYINGNYKLNEKFIFNLSHTLKLIKSDNSILDVILRTSFRNSFEIILSFYENIIQIRIPKPSPKIDLTYLILGYNNILQGRSKEAILCKYIMIQYVHNKEITLRIPSINENPTGANLDPQTISYIMASFPFIVGTSINMDLEFCDMIWMYNYHTPFAFKPDDTAMEENHFNEMNIDVLTQEFNELYQEVKNINLLHFVSRPVAEINMGFIARVCNLSLDIINFVKIHKGEIAEITYRVALECFITASWLLKKRDPALYQRFRAYSLGREKFTAERIASLSNDDAEKESVEKVIREKLKEEGVREVDVAIERGDVFEKRIDQMAEEVWGKDNSYYLDFKRHSEVIHGHWKVIAKYHLAKSYNPLHNGLYWYNENPNRFAGLVPAFAALMIAVDFLKAIVESLESEELVEVKNKAERLSLKVIDQYMVYYRKYILDAETDIEE